MINIFTNSLRSMYRCPALNDNKIKHYVSSIVKYIGEIDTFSNIGPHRVSYVLSRSQISVWHH
jgi:neutral trehalase